MKTYDSYKESGIQWIGEIPEHWEVKKLKFSDEVIMGQSPSSEDYIDDENAMPFLQGNADFTDIFPYPRIYCNTANKITQENDVLLSVRAPIGAINISNKKYGIGRGLCAIRAFNSHFKFLYYHSLLQKDELNSIGTGSTYTAIAVEDVKNSIYVFPPLPEQTAIANYLDTKTTDIDQIIADKEALINLYEEEKKALINEAVTKGVTLTGVETSSPKLKPSGIDWLGDVPEHWEVKKLFYLFDKISSGTTPKSDEESYYLDGEINWLNTGDLNNSRITETSKKITKKAFDDHSALKIYPVGSIVIAMYGATIGKLGILDIETTTNQACCVLSDIKNTNTLFVFNCLLAGQDALINLSYGGGQPNISQDTLRNFRIPIPPLAEQAAIVHHIETETAIINDKINRIKQEIELLKEYRQALIFEAVTGKIRVH